MLIEFLLFSGLSEYISLLFIIKNFDINYIHFLFFHNFYKWFFFIKLLTFFNFFEWTSPLYSIAHLKSNVKGVHENFFTVNGWACRSRIRNTMSMCIQGVDKSVQMCYNKDMI